MSHVPAARAARRAIARLARQDPSVFNSFVLRHEQTGARIHQAPMHKQWHKLINDQQRLIIWSHVDGGKTNQIAIGRVLWELGKNPNLRVVIVSKTSDLAKKIVRAVGQYIAGDAGNPGTAALHEVFPNLQPTKNPSLPWTSLQLTVERDGQAIAKDASVQSTGNYGNIHGSRIDLLILDDILDFENTRTATPRQHLWEWVRGTLFGRLSEGARVVFIGNAWHPDDVLHRFERESRFVGYRFPVTSPTGQLTWPEHWPHSRIEEQREDMGPHEFSRALLCQARDDEAAIFKRDWIDLALASGMGMRLRASAVELYDDLNIGAAERELIAAADSLRRMGDWGAQAGSVQFFTGVDLAVKGHDSADHTVLFTIAVFPNGQRRVVWIESGRWGAPEILSRIKDHWTRFGSTFVVENNAAQDYICQILRDQTAIPLLPITTGRQKADHAVGVASMSIQFYNGKWTIPSGPDGKQRSKDIDAWILGLINYDPRSHTSDWVMASWFADFGARVLNDMTSRGGVSATVVGPDT